MKLKGTYGERLYGSLSTSGYEALDTVCFTSDPNHCIDNFQWFAVTFQDGGLASYKDGILGLTTQYNQFVTGPSLVWQMYEQSIIEEPVFAFYLAGPYEDSYFDAGVIQESAMKDPSKLIELDVINDNAWWMNYLRGVAFDGVEYMLDKDIAITDTGTSCVYMPQQYYDDFMSHVLSDVSSHDNYIRCQDIGKLPKIEFNFGNYWFEMNPEDYTVR